MATTAGRPLADRWILSRLANTVATVDSRMEDYDFGGATQVTEILAQQTLYSDIDHLVPVLPHSQFLCDCLAPGAEQSPGAFNCYELAPQHGCSALRAASRVAQAIYGWWLYEMCDVFIELSKPVLSGEGGDAGLVQTTRDTLWVCLDTGLRCGRPPLRLLCHLCHDV
jgi:valyl-tRNA synthetase